MSNQHQSNFNGTGLSRILRAFWCSIEGLKAAWKNEAAFRQELILCLVLLPVALFLGESGIERALLTLSLTLVLIVELVNSAIEAVVDRIGPERHTLSGLAKDLGSAAVALALFQCMMVWGLVLIT